MSDCDAVPVVTRLYLFDPAPLTRRLLTWPVSSRACTQKLDGASALISAAQEGHLKCVRELLSPHQHAVTGVQVFRPGDLAILTICSEFVL